jgi:hypothetical protein
MLYKQSSIDLNHASPITYHKSVHAAPGIVYRIKLEVLQNYVADPQITKVTNITLNNEHIGECNPPDSFSCNFYNCGMGLSRTEISSTTGSIKMDITYEGQSQDCECDKDTWECRPEMDEDGADTTRRRRQTSSDRTSMAAVARITLNPIRNTKSKMNYSTNYI